MTVILADVNVLVYAFRPQTPFHQLARDALTAFRGRGDLAILSETAAAFVRIVTDPRLNVTPDDPSAALEFIDAVTARGRLLREPRLSRWQGFAQIVRRDDVRGSLVPDALVASTCQDMRAAVLTADRDFLRFLGLRVLLLTPEGIISHVVVSSD